MLLLYLLTVLTTSGFCSCKLVKSGVFDNVTIVVKGLDKTQPEEKIVIDFDDNLSEYVRNKPSEIITIKDQYIPKLESGSVSNLPKLQDLTLIRNGIRELRRGAFKNLPKLKLLDLSHNSIEEIRQGIFNDLPLDDLFLNHNRISRIGYKAFSNLNLRSLVLHNNRISRWSKEWVADSSVVVLDFSNNLIEDLPPNSFSLMSPVNDTSLIFSNNQLKKINNHVFHGLERFQRIFFDNNLINWVNSGVFEGVKYVNTLNFNNNSISEISGELLKTTQVDVFMVEDNKLRCLSTDLFRMEELDVDGNPITCSCVRTWLEWRNVYSNPSIYHISNLEEECI